MDPSKVEDPIWAWQNDCHIVANQWASIHSSSVHAIKGKWTPVWFGEVVYTAR